MWMASGCEGVCMDGVGRGRKVWMVGGRVGGQSKCVVQERNGYRGVGRGVDL